MGPSYKEKAQMEKVMLNPERVKVLFGIYNHQADVMIALCKMVYPEWDRIETIGDDKMSWPVVNNKTWKAICGLFMEFDQQHHPDVMNGGLWMNKGFSYEPDQETDLADWEVRRAPFTLKKFR